MGNAKTKFGIAETKFGNAKTKAGNAETKFRIVRTKSGNARTKFGNAVTESGIGGTESGDAASEALSHPPEPGPRRPEADPPSPRHLRPETGLALLPSPCAFCLPVPDPDAPVPGQGIPLLPRQVVIENPVINSRPLRQLLPILQAYGTREDKCHVNHVACDTDQWEQKVAQALEEMPQVRCYVKNQDLEFEIPYTLGGQEHRYVPDFLVKWDDGQPDPLNLILECSGEKRRDKEAKVATALNQWVPAVNNHGGFGRWAFVEVGDPWLTTGLLASYRGLT